VPGGSTGARSSVVEVHPPRAPADKRGGAIPPADGSGASLYGLMGYVFGGASRGGSGRVTPQRENSSDLLSEDEGEQCRRIKRKMSLNEVRQKTIFPDGEKLKEQVRQSIDASAYDVERLYHTVGCFQALARNNIFKNITFLVILLNAVWIAIDTDFNKAEILIDAPWEFQVVENAFCAYFAFEIVVRYKAFAKKRDAFSDGWFVFDSFLVTLMVWSTWVTPLLYVMLGGLGTSSVVMQNSSIFRVFRLFRLTRVARLARLMKDIPEIMVLIKGMVFAMRAVFSTLILLVMVIYVFAIMFTEMLAGSDAAEGCFENVPQSMNCLLLNGIFADQSPLITKLLDVHWMYYVVVLVYMVVGSLTILNMLIGVMCEVVQMVSEAEKDALRAQNLKDKIEKILKGVDTNDDHSVSKDEFRVLLQNIDAMAALSEVKVDVCQLIDFAAVIFEDKDELPVDDFVETVLSFRHDNTATVKDLIDNRRALVAEIEMVLESRKQ